MRGFFKSKRFRLLAVILAVLILLSGISGIIGMKMEPQSTVIGSVIVPVQKLTTFISDKISGFVTSYRRAQRLEEENDLLREQVRGLTDNLIDYEEYKNENEYLRSFLDIKEANGDYKFQNARIISVDSASGYLSYTVDSGSLSGIGMHDPVMTRDGLVGYVTSVSPTYCTVTTLLDPSISIGACCTRTGDYGVVSGITGQSGYGDCRMDFLSASTVLSQGDYIVTSGLGGVFPAGIVIGTVSQVNKGGKNIAAYAGISPSADLEGARDVMIITSFDGQQTAE